MDETQSEKSKGIKEQLKALVQLQHLDLEINQRRAEIVKFNQKIEAENQKIAALKKILASSKAEMDGLLKDRRAADVDLKQKQELIEKLGGQLFDVKNNLAYQTMQSEIKQRKQEQGLLEERILEMMLAEDEIKLRIQKAEAEYKANEQAALNQQAQYRLEISVIEKGMSEYGVNWEAAAKHIQADYFDLYKRLRDNKGGMAMSKIENNICSGCRIAIRAQAAIELQKYRGLLYCDNCARILYVD